MSADRALGRKQRRKRAGTDSDETPSRPLQTKQLSVTSDDPKVNKNHAARQRRRSSVLPLVLLLYLCCLLSVARPCSVMQSTSLNAVVLSR